VARIRFQKRQKEMKRLEKRRIKAERRVEIESAQSPQAETQS